MSGTGGGVSTLFADTVSMVLGLSAVAGITVEMLRLTSWPFCAVRIFELPSVKFMKANWSRDINQRPQMLLGLGAVRNANEITMQR